MKFLFLEPFFGGSHREFAQGLRAHSSHEIDLATLPARFWKWRMGGSALAFHRMGLPLGDYDGIIATDMMNLCDFMALSGPRLPPVLLYFHENQFSYPLMPGETLDLNYGLVNTKSALAAARVVFNSRFHQESFFSEVRSFCARMPDARPGWIADTLAAKASVLYPGCRFPQVRVDQPEPEGSTPLVVWNHRWEYDKNPDAFFNALETVRNRGRRFRLALLGERYGRIPPVFNRALQQFRDEISVSGFMTSRRDYLAWLNRGSVVISTAIQENFGISVVEAVRFGCLPLLPDRLSYPELMPVSCHDQVLYSDQEELIEKLDTVLKDISAWSSLRRTLSEMMAIFSWSHAVKAFDRELETLARCL